LSLKPGCVNIPLVVKNLCFLLIILLCCGCSSSKKKIIAESLDATAVITGSVVNSSAFTKGGTLVLGAFKAGTNAAADDETDQLSSMMIKGIRETLPEDNTTFSIQAADSKDPDCFLEGYIDEYAQKGNKARFSIDGEIWLRSTGEKILVFQTSTVINLKNQDPKTAAYQIGVAIAHFIGSHNI